MASQTESGKQPSKEAVEEGSAFLPKFDEKGLLTAVVLDASTGEVLVVAYMDQAAIDKTIDTGRVTFWSRSRRKLWTKGETSGHFLLVDEILVDCDQDALVIRATPEGPTCHTGRPSCFYRRLERGTLVKVNT
ncbi:MAG: phosphoribosyl-AMP cyclohydrolase [Pseudomonadota bacterium]